MADTGPSTALEVGVHIGVARLRKFDAEAEDLVAGIDGVIAIADPPIGAGGGPDGVAVVVSLPDGEEDAEIESGIVVPRPA